MNRSEFHCVLRYGSVWDASLHGSSADDVSIASLHSERHTAMRLSHSNHEACQSVYPDEIFSPTSNILAPSTLFCPLLIIGITKNLSYLWNFWKGTRNNRIKQIKWSYDDDPGIVFHVNIAYYIEREFLSRVEHTDARYWYKNSFRLSVRL